MKSCIYNGDFADGYVTANNIPFKRGVPVLLPEDDAAWLSKHSKEWAVAETIKPAEVLPVNPTEDK